MGQKRIAIISVLLFLMGTQIVISEQAHSQGGSTENNSPQALEVRIYDRGVLLPIVAEGKVKPKLLNQANQALDEIKKCIIDFVVLDDSNPQNQCNSDRCLQEVLNTTGADFVFLPKITTSNDQIVSFGGRTLHNTGQAVDNKEDVSAFSTVYSSVAVGLSQNLQIPFGEGIVCSNFEQLNRDITKIKEQGPVIAQGSNLSDIETETEYPIVGPVILGATGLTLTSLAIASLVSEKCEKRDPTGACISKKGTDAGAVFGFGATGVGAITGAVMWFLLGAEEVPITIESTDKQSWNVNFQGKF